jgi:beta-xylosidase
MISKRFKTTLLPLCVALVSVCGAPGATAQAFGSQTETKEPTTAPALLTLPQMPLHDPWIVADRATRVYYLYTSNVASITGVPGIGTMLYTSRNLHDWTRPKVVFRIPRGIWANAGGWAPEVHAYRGRYWLFTTLHNETAKLPPSRSGRTTYRRGTVLAVSDRLEGPFRLVRSGEPVAPPSLMTLDGTLYVDRSGMPWLVYAHEWIQRSIGTMEAMPLTRNLAAKGRPVHLFSATDASWPAGQAQVSPSELVYVTDGPELFRTHSGTLLMLWSSWAKDGYTQSIARSRSGGIKGPWDQLDPLVHRDSGHGMLFKAFDGTLMLVLHRPFKNARGKLYQMRDAGDRVEIVRERTDLDGDDPEKANP